MEAGLAADGLEGEDAPRPRAVVFTTDEASSLRVGSALRDALWGEQAVATRAGDKPDTGAAAFKSAKFKAAGAGKGDFESLIGSGGASVLVVPMSEGRGLDFPDVTHVYCLNLCLDRDYLETGVLSQTSEYAHMAGRTGRVGQAGTGVVTSVLNADTDWSDVLRALTAIVCVVARDTTGRSLEAVPIPTMDEEEDVRSSLNDLYNLDSSEQVDEEEELLSEEEFLRQLQEKKTEAES